MLTRRSSDNSILGVVGHKYVPLQNTEASKLIRIKHTKNVAANLESVQEIMNLADSEFEATANQYRMLTQKDINSKDLEKYVKLVFNATAKLVEVGGNVESLNNKRIIEQIVPLFEKGRGNDMKEIKGTMWAAYNAVNEYLQYERGSDNSNRMDNMWFGDSARLNKKALETTLIMAA